MSFIRFGPVHLFQNSIGCREGDECPRDHGADHCGPREISGDDHGNGEGAGEDAEGDGVDGEGEVEHGVGPPRVAEKTQHSVM